MNRLTNVLVIFVRRYLPDAFSISLLLTGIVILLGIFLAQQSAKDMMTYWGEGLFGLLPFTMQMILIMITGYALAISPIFTKNIKKLCSIPKTPTQAVLFAVTVTMVLTYINWGFGLIAAALIARELAVQQHGKGLHFPLIVAGTYCATQITGISSAATLTVATKGHFLEQEMGIVPLTSTLFSPMGIIMNITAIIIVPLIFWWMMPKKKDAIEPDLESIRQTEETAATIVPTEKMTPSERMEDSKILGFFAGLLGLVYLIIYFADAGFDLTVNVVIMIMLTAGIFAHKTPKRYYLAIAEGIKTCAGIALLFGFYAGIMGMMRNSGLAVMLSEFFVSISTEKTLPMITYLSAGLLNIFIPSGGGQWAVQGPVMVKAALDMGVDPAKIVMGVTWGDLWTNQIQPFWAIPILAIAKLGVRDIMGYGAMVTILQGIVFSILFYLM